MLVWRTPRDQWFSEAFAQLSCAEYVKTALGDNEYIAEMNWWEGLAKLYDDRGPIALGGYQLGDGYVGMIYYKAPYVMHQLKMTIGPEAFFKILNNWFKYKPFKPNTTEDFQFVLEKSLGEKQMMQLFGEKDMTWYFDQWLYSTGIPL